jgi:hypothetical protein
MSAPLTTACRAAVEGFTNNTDPSRKRDIYVDTLAVLLAFVIALVILGFIGKWLWNLVIVELFSIAKPARSFWQIIGLMIFVSLIRV